MIKIIVFIIVGMMVIGGLMRAAIIVVPLIGLFLAGLFIYYFGSFLLKLIGVKVDQKDEWLGMKCFMAIVILLCTIKAFMK